MHTNSFWIEYKEIKMCSWIQRKEGETTGFVLILGGWKIVFSFVFANNLGDWVFFSHTEKEHKALGMGRVGRETLKNCIPCTVGRNVDP